MKSVSPKKLCESYMFIYPGEITDVADGERILKNWLDRYKLFPEKAIATCNWYGKVTTALFHALFLEKPRTKRDMLITLMGDE
jgi:hypothetical protein